MSGGQDNGGGVPIVGIVAVIALTIPVGLFFFSTSPSPRASTPIVTPTAVAHPVESGGVGTDESTSSETQEDSNTVPAEKEIGSESKPADPKSTEPAE